MYLEVVRHGLPLERMMAISIRATQQETVISTSAADSKFF